MNGKVYVIEGVMNGVSNKLLVTTKYYKKDFEWIIKLELKNFNSVIFEMWSLGECKYGIEFNCANDVMLQDSY